MYLMIAKGQIAQKISFWFATRLKSKIKGIYKYLVVLGKLAAPEPMLLQVVNGSSILVLNNSACKTVSSSTGSPGLINNSK